MKIIQVGLLLGLLAAVGCGSEGGEAETTPASAGQGGGAGQGGAGQGGASAGSGAASGSAGMPGGSGGAGSGGSIAGAAGSAGAAAGSGGAPAGGAGSGGAASGAAGVAGAVGGAGSGGGAGEAGAGGAGQAGAGGSGQSEAAGAEAGGSGSGEGGAGQGGAGQAGSGQAGAGQAGQGGAGEGGAGQAGSGQGGQAGSGQGGAGESVTLRSVPCEKSPPQASKCESYEVVCEGLEPAVVDIAYFDAKGAKKGTILFGSGGDGTGFYNFTESKAMLTAGYTLVDRRWPKGWFTGAKDGPQQAACRLAAVVRMLRKTVAAEGPLCATGNSGGSAENVYSWTWQGAGESLDFALPTSGPFHRLDLACQGQSDAGWVKQCEALVAERCPDCASNSCQLGNGPRGLLDVSFDNKARCTQPGPGDLEILKQRSPIEGPFVAKLGKLPIKFLVGKDDPGAYAPLATSLVDGLLAAGAKVEVSYVTGAPHEMDSTAAGAVAIRDALLAGCKAP